MTKSRLATALGFFSLGLGVAELVAGRRISHSLGLGKRGGETLVRAFGLREVVNGAAILADPDAPGPVWARVGGDALDLAVLADAALDGRNRARSNAALALAAVAGVTLLDVVCARGLSAEETRRRETARRTRVRHLPAQRREAHRPPAAFAPAVRSTERVTEGRTLPA